MITYRERQAHLFALSVGGEDPFGYQEPRFAGATAWPHAKPTHGDVRKVFGDIPVGSSRFKLCCNLDLRIRLGVQRISQNLDPSAVGVIELGVVLYGSGVR